MYSSGLVFDGGKSGTSDGAHRDEFSESACPEQTGAGRADGTGGGAFPGTCGRCRTDSKGAGGDGKCDQTGACGNEGKGGGSDHLPGQAEPAGNPDEGPYREGEAGDGEGDCRCFVGSFWTVVYAVQRKS